MVYIITFLLFFLPFIILPLGISPFETPKVITVQLAVIVLIVLFISRRSIPLKELRSLWLFVPFVFFMLYSVIFRWSDTVLFGNSFRMQGVFLFFLLISFAFIASKVKFIKLPLWQSTLLLLLHLIGALVIVGQFGRAVGFLGEPNALASLAVFSWPFLLFRKKELTQKRTVLIGIGILLTLLIIIASGSRSGMIAFTLQLLFFLSIRFTRIAPFPAVMITLLLLGGSYTLPFLEREQIYENRVEVWKTAAVTGLREPLFGHGIGNTAQALTTTVDETKNNLGDLYVDSSHNIFLDYVVQMGVLGLLTLLFFIYRAFQTFLQRKCYRKIMLLLGMLTVLSFNPGGIVGLVHFWWLLGQGMHDNKAE